MGSSGWDVLKLTKGHEKEFYRLIKTYITGLDSRITCNNDPDDEFDASKSGADHIATLDFDINGEHAFSLYRNVVLKDGSGNEQATCTIICAMDIDNAIPSSVGSIHFRADGYTGITIVQSEGRYDRGLRISHVINDDFIFLTFAPPDYTWQSIGTVETTRIIHSFTTNKTYVTSDRGISSYTQPTIFNLSGLTFYDVDGVDAPGTFLSRFSYAAPAGSIDYIKSSIYQSGNVRSFENTAIYDCTTVTTGDTVSLKDGAYVAIGPHQLVKVS